MEAQAASPIAHAHRENRVSSVHRQRPSEQPARSDDHEAGENADRENHGVVRS